MSDPEQVVQRLDAAYNAKDAEARPWAVDGELLEPGVHLRGRAQIEHYERALWAAFPDVHLRVQRQIASGSLVATEGLFTATHTGVLTTPEGEVPPTGRAVQLAWSRMVEVRGDEVVWVHVYFDRLDLLGQLGLVPESA